MTEQLADDRQPEAATGAEARIGMAEVMKPNALRVAVPKAP
jgi:hypothetical protein